MKTSSINDRPVLAICYDFDKTLTPDNMQEPVFIPELGWNVKDFWTKTSELAIQNEMDPNLSYMYMMLSEAKDKITFTRDALKKYGSSLSLFPGVDTWFERICSYGAIHNVAVEHYIISSGLKEMIEGTSVAKHFSAIYASSFLYNEKGIAVWPAQAVNYTNKTQFLFRISKGTIGVNEDVNQYIHQSELHVPFRNMVYIGDSDTDIPCMKLVNSYNGHAIGVYNDKKINDDDKRNDKATVYRLFKEHRIRYFAPANYTEGSELDKLVKAIIERTEKNDALEKIHYENEKEAYNNKADQ